MALSVAGTIIGQNDRSFLHRSIGYRFHARVFRITLFSVAGCRSDCADSGQGDAESGPGRPERNGDQFVPDYGCSDDRDLGRADGAVVRALYSESPQLAGYPSNRIH